MKDVAQKVAYSPEEFGKLIGVHEQTVYRFLRSGQIKAVKLGRKWVIPHKTLEAFLNGEQKTPQGAA